MENDWLSQKIAMNAIDKYLDEYEKDKPGDELTLVKRDSDGRYNYITTEGVPISDMWFDGAFDFRDGFARVYVYKVKGDKKLYNYIDTKGNLLSEKWFKYADSFHDGWGYIGEGEYINAKGETRKIPGNHISRSFSSGRAFVWNDDGKYYFMDTDFNRVGDRLYSDPNDDRDYAPIIETNYVDGYAITKFDSGWAMPDQIIDKDGNALPQDKHDVVVPWGNIGYGYYLAGQMDKINGVKLKDAKNNIILDYFNKTSSPLFLSDKIKQFFVRNIGKKMPYIGYDSHSVGKEDGVLFFGNYWFLGPSNVTTTKERDGYHAKSPFGEFITKYPPINAISDNYLLCAHNNSVCVYDKKTNTYGKACTSDEVRKRIRERIEKKTYEKVRSSLKAIIGLNKRGVLAKLAVSSDVLLRDAYYREHKGEKYEIQPAFLEVPGTLNIIDFNDYNDYYVYYGNEIKRLSEVIKLEKAKNTKVEGTKSLKNVDFASLDSRDFTNVDASDMEIEHSTGAKK